MSDDDRYAKRELPETYSEEDDENLDESERDVEEDGLARVKSEAVDNLKKVFIIRHMKGQGNGGKDSSYARVGRRCWWSVGSEGS
jgi:hypothetical protein